MCTSVHRVFTLGFGTTNYFFYCRIELAAAHKQAAKNSSEWEAEFNVHHHHVQQNILPQQADISGERITLNQQNNLK